MEYIKGRGAQFNIPNSFLKTSILLRRIGELIFDLEKQ
jgi:hypothetical protein